MREFAGQFIEARREEVACIPGWLAEGQLDRVVRLGHQIKGTATTFGLPEIGAAGARLEAAARAGDLDAASREAACLRELFGGS